MTPTINATTRMILRKLGITIKQHKGNVNRALYLAGEWAYENAHGRNAAARMEDYASWCTFLGYDPLANTLV